MSGRIWVVEWNMGKRMEIRWVPEAVSPTRAKARMAQAKIREDGWRTRVVQYVRQGGAR